MITQNIDLLSLDELKSLVTYKIRTLNDRPVIDQAYQLFEKDDLETRLKNVLMLNTDSAQNLPLFSKMILETEGSYDEKVKFINQYPDGFLNLTKLITEHEIHSFSELFECDDFVRRVVRNFMDYQTIGVGPAEYAFCLTSPRIKSAGRLGAPGDLIINDENIEVKAQKSPPGKTKTSGRFTDSRKVQVNMLQAKQVLKDAGLEVPPRINFNKFIELVQVLPIAKRTEVVTNFLNELFLYCPPVDLIPAIVLNLPAMARTKYIYYSFENYKKASKFDGMLLVDTTKERTLFFKTITQHTLNLLKCGTIYVIGPEQEVFPQISF